MILVLLVFSLLFIPHVGLIPSLDGNIDLQQFYFHVNNSIHPPLKFFLMNVFFKAFGYSSYSWIGYLFGIIGIIAIYKLALVVFKSNKIAITSSILLATNGLFVSNGLYSLTDFMATNLLIIALYFLIVKNYLFYAITASLIVLTKETALLIPCLSFIFFTRKKSVYFIFPIVVALGWFLFLKTQNLQMWNQQNFSNVASRGSFYTIWNNMTMGKIFNKYFYQNLLNLFVFNFNWFFWIIAVLGIRRVKFTRFLLFSILFCLSYIVLVLSFPTWPIPRYVLPVIPFMILLVSYSLSRLSIIGYALTAFVVILSLFYTIDPISLRLWGTRELLGSTFYNNTISGNDGMTFNMQYFYYTKERNDLFYSKVPIDCFPLFLGSPDDSQTRQILHLASVHCK